MSSHAHTETRRCPPAAVFAPWPLLSQARLLRADAGGQQVVCSPTLKGPAQTTCHSYTALSNYLGTAGGLLEATASVAYGKLSDSQPKLATDIWSITGTIYTLMQGVNDEFLLAIGDLNAGKPFEPMETPSNLGPFPPPPTKGTEAKGVVDGVWTAVKGALENVLATYRGEDRIRIVVSGLINNGDNAIRQLIPMLEQAFG